MPNIWRLCLILWCSSLSGLSFASETASFYGASYISVPFQEAKSTTTISFKFRTKRSDAILFLSAGKIDYCLLRLESGRLKVHINLGAGDTEISTPRGLRLDDLLWHSVNVTRIEANVSLTVDLIHTTFEKLPGKFFELNIHYGLFIGGQGDFTELFLGHVDWLRGCMSDVIYNNIDTLKRARARSSQADAQGVLWSCSAEFDSSHDSEISFVDDGAFLSLPQVVQRAGVRLTFDLKTDSISGILVYSSGPMSGGRADFLGLEIVNRRLRLLLDTGNGVLSLTSDLVVSTGEWVSISLVLSPSLVEILIDGHQGGMLKLPNQGTKYLDLADTIYIGGIELNKRARALSQGLKTADVSLKGCVRRLEVDSKPLGLGEAKVSSGLLAECVWSFPCLSSPPPCTSLTPCTQLGVASSSCECSGGSCANPEFNITNPDRTPLAVALEIIRLEPLTVSEGENTLLTSVHITLVLDAARYGVRESGVMFHIRSPPSHGTLHLEIWEHDAHSGQMFTLLDLAKDKVRYIHDGSESRLDSFECELALSPGPGFLLPPYLQGRHWFRFHIQITPVNDPPTLTIPTGKVLRLAQGTRKTLTPDLLLAQDLDSPPASLVIRVNESHAERGHLERLMNGSSKSGDPEHQTVTAFTMEELTAGLVQYVHSGGEASGQSNYKLALQVSDGVASSNLAYLNIAVYPLELRRENNTGVLLIHNSHTLITSANLSFVINSDDTEVVIVYQITTPPLFGSLQTLKVDHSISSSDSKALSGQAGDNWQSASEFTDAQIRRSQVRYLHREGTPGEDAFKFTVSLRPTPPTTNDNSPPYTFSIHFVQLTLLGLSNPRTWFDSHSRELLLTPMHLSYDTSPLPVPPNTIVYKISRPLRYGNLSRRGNSAGLSTGDVFTQAEINTGELYYSLHRTTYSNVTDTMEFTVSAPHCETLSDRNLSFVYTPDVSLLRKLTVTISNLQVVEGGQERLSGGIMCHGVSSLSYEVTLPPRYGGLDLTEAVTSKKIATRNITRFSGTQLSRSLIMYTHDDSESKTDRMEYVAISSDKEDFQYIGSISVSVALTNDNAPRRSANQSLEVVLDSSHLLLPSHLSYADEDMDATGHNIIYSVRSSQGGALYSAVSPLRPLLPLADFSQADIDSGRVKYRHQSNLSDTTVLLRVSDGAHFVEGVLHVHASAPYVRVVNSTRLIVKEGGEAVLTPEHLSCETNVDMNPAQIKYDILEYPSYGEIQFRKPAKYSDAANSKSTVEAHKRGDLSITSFSQRDIMAGSLVYVQNGALGPGHSIKRDVFKLRLDAGDQAWNDTLVLVSIYPALYYTGLVRTRNETLLIEESTGFVISRQSLLIEQPGVPPSDIVYHVTQGPAYGYLELDPPLLAASNGDSVSSDPVSVVWFDQQAINDERLHYVQAGGQNRTQDFFLLDVTNGILWIRGLQVNIIIVPEHIYLSSGDSVSVDEGGNITLLPSLLPLLSPYYQNRVTEYRVIRQSKHGALYFSSNKVAIMRWTPQQLQAGQIQYIHDGSESGNDSFTLVARAGDKESNPATVNIIILPVNDQVPHVKNNTGVVMYRGATVTLTNDNLACVDLDTAPENLTYTVTSSHHGHLALKSGPAQIIHNFTQAQINSGTVVFTHLGDEAATAGFEATVSDSLHSTSSFSFLITTLTPRLVLARAHGLSVFPMLSKVISSNELAAWSSDKERSVLYVVTQLPSHGFLHVNDKAAYELPLNFTQADVNNSRVSYQHSSPFRDPDLNDTFRFNVFADFTEPVLNKTFPIHISVSYGGLESLVTPHISLAVIEGGTSPIQLNTSAIVAFLSERVGLHSPTLSLSLLVEPSHGAVCECKNNEHNRRKAKREIGERNLHIGNRDQEEEEGGGVAGLSEDEHMKRSVKREIEELSGHNLNRDYEELAAGVLNVNGGSRSRWDLKRVEEDVGDLNEVNEHSKPRNTALEKSVGDLSALEKLDTELGDLKHDDVDGESAHRPRVKREVEESIRHADALTDVSRSNDNVRQLSDAHRFQRDKRKSFDLEYENNRLSGDPSVRQTLDLTNSVYSNKPNKKSNASARYTDRSSQSSLESEYPPNSEDQRLLDSEEKRNQEYLRQYEAYYNRRAQEQRYRNSQERNGQNSHERTSQNQSNHDRMSQREQNGVRETIYGRDKSVDRNPDRITGDDKYSKFVEPRLFQPSQTQEGVQMRGDAENLEVEPGQFGSDEYGTDDRKDHWRDGNGRNIPNSRHSENGDDREQTNGTSRAADDHGSVRETHVTNDENLANNKAADEHGSVRETHVINDENLANIGRQSAEKSRGQNSPGVQSGNSAPSSENSLEQISGAARTSNEWTRGDSDRVRTNEFAKRNKAKSGGNVPARGNWEAPVSEKGGVLANEASIPLSQSQCSKDSGLLYFYDSVNLCYHHDHSDSLSDSLTISIYLYPGDVLLTNVSVDIVVSPINDQPFVLRTLKPHVNVVQGHEVRLTARDLYTEDNDTSPADIVYEIITQPTVGYIKIVDPELIAVGKSGVQRRSVDGQSEDEEEFNSHVDTLSHTKEEVKSDDDQDVKPDSEKVRIETTDSDTQRSSVDNTKTIPSKEKVILDDTTNLRERSIGLSDSVHDTNTSVEEEKKNNVIQTNVQRMRFQRDINVMNDIPVSRHAQNYASNFTQQDVNTGRVVYVHNSNNTGTISFYFRVHDGKFNPAYNLFNINIVPIRLSIDIKKPVPIRQTDSLALIPASIFSIQSNLNSYAHLRFLVTRPPINGHIYVSEKKADSFSYSDLEAGNVLYMQTNMASFADMLELECDVLNLVTLEKLFVNITVEPLVNVSKFEPVAGLRNKISSEILNVDLLAALSNANPLFKIIKKPRYGKIKKIIRSTGGSGDLRESEIARFTYDQLRHGQVYYVASGKLNASSTDCFVYLLNASVYQPAIGEFCFRVAIQATPALNSPKSRINNNYNNNMELSSPNISNDYALIVAMIAAVILLSVVIVFIVRMRSKRLVQRKKSALQDTAGDHVVKSEVTPTSQPVAMRGMIKYPYGAVEQEEEEPSEGVPPLRRNQYWV